MTGHTSLWTKHTMSRVLVMAAMTPVVVFVFAYYISCIWLDQNAFASISLFYHFTSSLRLLPSVYAFEQLACKTILLTLVTHTYTWIFSILTDFEQNNFEPFQILKTFKFEDSWWLNNASSSISLQNCWKRPIYSTLTSVFKLN